MIRNFATIKRIGVVCCIVMIASCLSGPDSADGSPQHGESKTGKEKDRLLIFTGSDWSAESAQFMQTVLTEQFTESVQKQYTVRYIDLPRNTEHQDAQTIQNHYVLFSDYQVTEVPYIVLQTGNEDTYISQPIEKDIRTPEALLAWIAACGEKREQLAAARTRIAETSGHEKAAAIDAFLHTVLYPEAHRYDSLRSEVPKLDPDNQTGLKGTYILITADMKAKHFAQKEDFIEAGNAYKAAAETGILAPSELQLAWYLAAYSYGMSGKVDTAELTGCLQRAIQADPESSSVAQIKEVIQNLRKK